MCSAYSTQGEMVYKKRLANKIDVIIQALDPYYLEISSIVVKSTFNWYWLVDGLMKRGYKLHLANTSAIHQTKK